MIAMFESREKSNKESISAIEEEMQHFYAEKDS